jgi:hypothetical protein
MRTLIFVGVVLGIAALAASACSSGTASGTGNPSCETTASGGNPGDPNCFDYFHCGASVYTLDCSNGSCACVVNDAGTKTVPYEPAFCAVDAGSDLNAALKAANAACGWGL